MIYNIRRHLQITGKKKLVAVGVFVTVLGSVAGVSILGQHSFGAAPVRDCSTNAIDSTDTNGGCGAATRDELVDDLRADKPGDLKTIFADSRMGGITETDYERFKDTAVMGMAYKTGEVKVDGETVLTDIESLGREKINEDSRPVVIGDKTYYHSPASSSFVADQIPAMVMFDDKGEPEAAVLTACGNPIKGKKIKKEEVKEEFDCKMLRATPVPGQADTFDFTTEVITSGNVTVNRVVYDFGDGTPPVTEQNPATPVRHHFATPGTFTVKATVFFNVPDKKQIVEVPPSKCIVKITVTPPPPPTPPTPPAPPAPPQLPKAGPEGILNMFVGSSVAGAVAHRVYRSWRGKKS